MGNLLRGVEVTISVSRRRGRRLARLHGCVRESSWARISFSQPVRQAEVEPGRQNRKVPLARPAKARDCRVRGADLFEAQGAEHFAEAGHFLVQQRQQRLGRGVATGEAGAAGDQDAVDALVGDPLRDARPQEVTLSSAARARSASACPASPMALRQVVARRVVGRGARCPTRSARTASMRRIACLRSCGLGQHFQFVDLMFAGQAIDQFVQVAVDDLRQAYRVRPSTRWSVIRPCGKL